MKEIMVKGITYQVIKHEDTYLLIGKRGAQYKLLRNRTHPEMMFAIDARRSFKPVDRLGWFTDRKGHLETIL